MVKPSGCRNDTYLSLGFPGSAHHQLTTPKRRPAELFLSQKTVEAHPRNIFRKVGASSRVELARAVERADRDRA
jgi:Bacterial regulatory proteins, luxR family